MESLTKNRQSKEVLEQMIKAAVGESVHIGVNKTNILVNELTEGFYNIAYEIIMPETSFILKIAPARDATIMTYEKNIMEAEVKSLRLIKSQTKVPVPKVIFYDNQHTICDVDYFFMEKLEGESLKQLKDKGITDDLNVSILSQLGQYCFEMSELKGKEFGYFTNSFATRNNFRSTFLAMIESILEDGQKVEIDIGFDYDKIYNLIYKASEALNDVLTPSFVHWDLWEGNVFVKDGKISGLIDFERAMWTDPLMEYFFRANCHNKDFAAGFGADLRKEFPIKANLYDLYLYSILMIETKYRRYPDNYQYNFGAYEFKNAVNRLINYGYNL